MRSGGSSGSGRCRSSARASRPTTSPRLHLRSGTWTTSALPALASCCPDTPRPGSLGPRKDDVFWWGDSPAAAGRFHTVFRINRTTVLSSEFLGAVGSGAHKNGADFRRSELPKFQSSAGSVFLCRASRTAFRSARPVRFAKSGRT